MIILESSDFRTGALAGSQLSQPPSQDSFTRAKDHELGHTLKLVKKFLPPSHTFIRFLVDGDIRSLDRGYLVGSENQHSD